LEILLTTDTTLQMQEVPQDSCLADKFMRCILVSGVSR
jgi:hypothetical protein